ncbi:anti-sigma regulatory factor [Lusitaniella coriacea LEGE 07157]|uniref:Anti-sigma regulatory factor n=1 Tax=Lusitaniella coriacea LEGE 07157 TaxID=945747 RepID=A0A8J7IYJ3_9CYAN|nr:anti-sigma regulatory factor [Lusitaniella coriacea]MBE9119143.1 anti-sigma regulatory factor [Lusitaniella coriacea LEGE 07157]
MNTSKKFGLTVLSDLKEFNQVLEWFNQTYCDSIPQKDWLQCQLALAEGFTNAVRHAHKNLTAETPIEFEVTLKETSLEIRIWDRGPSFNLQEYFENLSQEPDYHSGGGRGIVLMYKIADRLTYTRLEDNRNCLLIVKNHDPIDC